MKKLKRLDVARLLAVSESTVRRAEGKFLFPRRDKRGIRYFDPVEVQAFGRMRGCELAPSLDMPPAVAETLTRIPGARAAQIVRLLMQGQSLSEVLLATEENLIAIREIQKIVHNDLARKKHRSRGHRERAIIAEWNDIVSAAGSAKKDPPGN